MKTSLRFALHQTAVASHMSEPPPPVVDNARTRKEHRAAVRAHHDASLQAYVGPEGRPSRYMRAMFLGILRRLRGQPSRIAAPLFSKDQIMPHLRPWAEKRGLL